MLGLLMFANNGEVRLETTPRFRQVNVLGGVIVVSFGRRWRLHGCGSSGSRSWSLWICVDVVRRLIIWAVLSFSVLFSKPPAFYCCCESFCRWVWQEIRPKIKQSCCSYGCSLLRSVMKPVEEWVWLWKFLMDGIVVVEVFGLMGKAVGLLCSCVRVIEMGEGVAVRTKRESSKCFWMDFCVMMGVETVLREVWWGWRVSESVSVRVVLGKVEDDR